MLVPIRMGTKMARAGNQQKHLSLSSATKGEIHLSRNSKTIKIILFPIPADGQISRNKSPNKSLFKHLGFHVNAASRKSLEIQP